MAHLLSPPLMFHARPISGAGRGKDLGTPTINLDLQDVPPTLRDGIFACRAKIDNNGSFEDAVMHYGPRPVFKDTPTCEVHLLDRTLEILPEIATIEVIGYLRDVRDFPTIDALKRQIARDIQDARAMLHSLS